MKESKISTIEYYIDKVSKLQHSPVSKTLYRGQANHEWSIHCSAYRRLSKVFQKISAIDLKIYLLELLNDAHRRIIETESDIELLIKIQHFGGATNLIDFSKNPLVALFFACNGEFNNDGKIFIITANRYVNENIHEMQLDVLKNAKISDLFKNNNLVKIPPPFHNNRVIKQESVLMMTKDGTIDDSYIETTLIIDKNAKKEILKKLASVYCISEENLFNDFHGWVLQNSYNNSINITPHVLFEYAEKLKCPYNALELYSKAIEIDDKNETYYFARGNTFEYINNFDLAIKDFEKVIELKTDYGEAYFRLARIYFIRGNYENAHNYCEKCLLYGERLFLNAAIEIEFKDIFEKSYHWSNKKNKKVT